MYKLILLFFVSYNFLKGEIFSLSFTDLSEIQAEFELLSNAFLENFIIILVASVPLFSVYAIYRIVKIFIS